MAFFRKYTQLSGGAEKLCPLNICARMLRCFMRSPLSPLLRARRDDGHIICSSAHPTRTHAVYMVRSRHGSERPHRQAGRLIPVTTPRAHTVLEKPASPSRSILVRPVEVRPPLDGEARASQTLHDRPLSSVTLKSFLVVGCAPNITEQEEKRPAISPLAPGLRHPNTTNARTRFIYPNSAWIKGRLAPLSKTQVRLRCTKYYETMG